MFMLNLCSPRIILAVAVFMDPNFNKRIKFCEEEIVMAVWMLVLNVEVYIGLLH